MAAISMLSTFSVLPLSMVMAFAFAVMAFAFPFSVVAPLAHAAGVALGRSLSPSRCSHGIGRVGLGRIGLIFLCVGLGLVRGDGTSGASDERGNWSSEAWTTRDQFSTTGPSGVESLVQGGASHH
jgi:hypothetical protein